MSQKRCFVIGPIGDDDSEHRIHADWLLEDIIKPVFDMHFSDFVVERADRLSDPGRIDGQVIAALLSADLVVADLTYLNPNVFYEIGIRHTVQKPIIHIHLEGERIPFDVGTFRTIRFSRKWPKDIRQARENLKQFVTSATKSDHKVDNPVTNAVGRIEIEKNAQPTDKLLLAEIGVLKSRIGQLERSGGSHGGVIRLRTGGPISDHGSRGTFRLELMKHPSTSMAAFERFVEGDVMSVFEVASYEITKSKATLSVLGDELSPEDLDLVLKLAQNSGIKLDVSRS